MNKLIKISKIGTPDIGFLSFFEGERDIPFDIKRIYYIYDTPNNIKRGMHAHKNIKQALWSPYGVIEVVLDNGREKHSFILDSPNKLLLICSGIWRDMYWRKEGSVLCVAASDYYNEEDYIRDYNEFLKYVEEGYWNNENKF